jgi:hypothetical protein
MEIEPQQTTNRSGERAIDLRIQKPQRRNVRHQTTIEPERPQAATPRRKPHELPPPIRAVVDQPRYSMEKFYNIKVDMTVGEVLDLSPVMRRLLAYGMKSSVLRVRKSKAGPNRYVVTAADKIVEEPNVVQELPKNDKIPTCLFITSWVNSIPLYRTLVDSGACVDLISPTTVQQLGLQPRPTGEPPWSLRVASDELVPVTECVDIPVNVAGIKMMVTAYITGLGGIYDLLLSRRWMEPMEAEENFKEKRFTIKGPDGKRLVILPTEDHLLSEDGVTQEEFEEEIAEDEIEELEDELGERMGTSAIVVTIVPSENA